MECLFNKLVPKSSENKIIIRPMGRTFVTGLSNFYDSSYPPQLEPFIGEVAFKNCMAEINNVVQNYWPCTCARFCGYWCCPFTLGLSFLVPFLCISDAESALQRQLDHFNRTEFKEKGLRFKLVKQCSTSWLELMIETSRKTDNYGIFETEDENEHKILSK